MIDILLPVYNGEKFLKEQIYSIFCQTYHDFRVVIRDDSSTDRSRDIINEYAMNPRVKIVEDSKGNLGSTKSFEELVSYVEGDYFMFCDQDDIWKPNKVEITLAKMMEEEGRYPETPILVCTDSTCVDQDGIVISESFYTSQKFEYTFDSREKMAALNVIQGNTCMLNKMCKQYIHDIPSDVVYDAWVGLTVAYFGRVFYLHEQTLYYRQHSHNAVGVKNISYHYFTNKYLHNKDWSRKNSLLLNSLPYKLNYTKWLFWKIYYTVKRSIL